jgi:thioredoxin-like negative regulator of GroEL
MKLALNTALAACIAFVAAHLLFPLPLAPVPLVGDQVVDQPAAPAGEHTYAPTHAWSPDGGWGPGDYVGPLGNKQTETAGAPTQARTEWRLRLGAIDFNTKEMDDLKQQNADIKKQLAELQAQYNQLELMDNSLSAAYKIVKQENVELKAQLASYETKAAEKPPEPQLRERYDDLASATAAAKMSGRKVLLLFTATWCSWCKPIENQTLADPTLKQYIADNLVFCLIDVDQYPQTARQFGASRIPVAFVFEPGKSSVPGFRPPANPNDFLATLKSL